MVAKRSTKMGKLMPYVDVRSEKDIPKFESMIKTGPVFVLVYADWCGHCKRFKENMWDEVATSKNKAVNTAALHYNMVDKTSMKNTNIEGYPTLFEVKPTPKANVSTPVKTPQNKTELENLVVANNVSVNNVSMNNGSTTSTMDPNMIRSQRMTQSSVSAEDNTFDPEPMESLPPPPEEEVVAAEQRGGGVVSGGSLMESLLKISADSAHAIVLAASAAELSRRYGKRRHTKKHRSSKKKQTRRK
jgi:thiol-disulfide isomerase/thioredoxin